MAKSGRAWTCFAWGFVPWLLIIREMWLCPGSTNSGWKSDVWFRFGRWKWKCIRTWLDGLQTVYRLVASVCCFDRSPFPVFDSKTWNCTENTSSTFDRFSTIAVGLDFEVLSEKKGHLCRMDIQHEHAGILHFLRLFSLGSCRVYESGVLFG